MIDIEVAKSWHKIFASHLMYAVAGLEPLAATAASVRDHNACQLGKWLHQLSDQFGQSAHYQHLAEAHRQYHRDAAEMLQHHTAGEIDDKAFEAASKAVLAAIDAFAPEFTRAYAMRTLPEIGSGTVWNDSMKIGVPVIDSQHKEIIEALTRLSRHPDLNTQSEFVIDIIHTLQSMMQTHFATEEAFMQRHGASPQQIAHHVQDHSHILETLGDVSFNALADQHVLARDIYRKLLKAFLFDLTTYDGHLASLLP